MADAPVPSSSPIRLSVCIPTYNRAGFLGELLESLVAQATGEVEIVVSDNASTDGTEATVARFRERFPRIVYRRNPENLGPDRNYLKAVEAASGEYCWLMGSDDVAAPDALSRLLPKLDSGDDVYMLGLTTCSYDLHPLYRHPVLDCPGEAAFDLSDPRSRAEYFRQARTTTPFFSYLSSIVVRRERWAAAGTDESFVGSAWVHVAQIFRMLPGGLRVRYLPDSYLFNRSGNDSFMDRGIVHRIAIAVDGYERIGATFFGADSPEAFHFRRTVRNEYTLPFLLHAKLKVLDSRGGEDLDRFRDLVRKLYRDPGLPVRAARLAILSAPRPLLKALERLNAALRSIRGGNR